MATMWYELARNPQAVLELYSSPPPVDDVDVHEIVLDRDGPAIRLRFDLRDFPDRPPKRWVHSGFNRAQIVLALWDVRSWSMQGWTTQNKMSISISRETNEELVADGKGPNCEFHAHFGFYEIAKITGYLGA